jgi:hypothetical protein
MKTALEFSSRKGDGDKFKRFSKDEAIKLAL